MPIMYYLYCHSESVWCNFFFGCCYFLIQFILISIKARTQPSDFCNHSIAGGSSITLSPVDTNLSKPSRCLETKGQFFSARDDIPCPAHWPNGRLDRNRFWHRAALARRSRLGDQLRLTLTRASLLSPDPTWHTSFTDASENEPILAIFSAAAVAAGLLSSLGVTNAVNWSIGVRWRFVLASRPSWTAVDAGLSTSSAANEWEKRGRLMVQLKVPSGTTQDFFLNVIRKFSIKSPKVTCQHAW